MALPPVVEPDEEHPDVALGPSLTRSASLAMPQASPIRPEVGSQQVSSSIATYNDEKKKVPPLFRLLPSSESSLDLVLSPYLDHALFQFFPLLHKLSVLLHEAVYVLLRHLHAKFRDPDIPERGNLLQLGVLLGLHVDGRILILSSSTASVGNFPPSLPMHRHEWVTGHVGDTQYSDV